MGFLFEIKKQKSSQIHCGDSCISMNTLKAAGSRFNWVKCPVWDLYSNKAVKTKSTERYKGSKCPVLLCPLSYYLRAINRVNNFPGPVLEIFLGMDSMYSIYFPRHADCSFYVLHLESSIHLSLVTPGFPTVRVPY